MARDGGEDRRDADIFISYQRENAQQAKRLAEALSKGNRQVWLDQKLNSDTRWRADIEQKLKRARCVVTIWSKKAVTSGWVNYEAYRAQQDGKLVAVSFDRQIDVNDLPDWMSGQQITNLHDWKSPAQNHNGWLNVSRTVSAKCSKLPEYRFKGWLGGGPTHERVNWLEFHPTEDALLASAGSEGDAAMWLASHASEDGRGAPNEDGSYLIVDPGNFGQTARYRAQQPEGTTRKNSVSRIQYSPDGERAVVALRSGAVVVTKRDLVTVERTLEHNAVINMPMMGFARGVGGASRDGVADACMLPDGRIVSVGGYSIIVWNEDGLPTNDRAIYMPDGAQAKLVRSLYSDLLAGVIVGDKLGKVRVLDPDAREVGFQIDDRENTDVHFALGPAIVEGRRRLGVLAIVSANPSDSEVKFHDWNNGAFSKARPQSISDDAPPIHALALHPTAPVLAMGSNAVRPRFYDYAMQEPLIVERAGWHDRAITAVAFSASGKYLAAGSEDGRISVWEDRSQPF